MLGPLRPADAGQADAGQDYQPGSMPGLADIDRLAAATTAAGVHVDVHWQGERRPLAPDIELAAYRIVQESVTNVVRHASARSCRVLITHDGEALSIQVADHGQGPGGATSGTGCGLAGMRERVALLHGEFSAGPGPGGGFLVTACLPLPATVVPA
jgi:signal transduction histidine kinase